LVAKCPTPPQANNQTFEFPRLFPEDMLKEDDKEMENMENMKKEYKDTTSTGSQRQGMPSWFSL